MIDEIAVRTRYEALLLCLDERGRRLFAAVEARTAGYGGIAAVARATGIAPSTIGRGLKDLAASGFPEGSVRRAGSGRQPLTTADPTLLEDLRRLVEPATMGDPVGVEEPRQACCGTAHDGASDRHEQHAQAAGRIEVQPAGQPKDQGRKP